MKGVRGELAVSVHERLSLISLESGSLYSLGVSVYSFTWSPDGQKVLYEQEHDLWVMDVETGQIENLTKTPDHLDSNASWSPDGQWIAFLRSRTLEPGETIERLVKPLTSRLVLVDSQGINYPEVDERPAGGYSWSPDSKRIIYTDAEGGLYIFDLDDEQRQPLIPADYGLQDDLYFSSAVWSPGGDEIAVSFSTRPKPEDTSMEAGCAILNLKDHTSSILKHYTVTLGMPYEGIPPGETLCCGGPGIQWSPARDHLLVNIIPLPRMDLPIGLTVMDTRNGGEISLARKGEEYFWAYAADWSLDGRWVAYVNGRDRSLWVVNPSNPAEKYQVMRAFCCEGPVAWRPE